jgi:hypothetical protein
VYRESEWGFFSTESKVIYLSFFLFSEGRVEDHKEKKETGKTDGNAQCPSFSGIKLRFNISFPPSLYCMYVYT